MINNRQGGRRRGRGGQRPQGMAGNAGNRQDNRQRGNAAQLLEKYKNLARDSQLAGDRVQTEYYLQYADHYFRVVEENRSRYEEQNPRARRRDDEDEDEGDELIDAEAADGVDSDGDGDAEEERDDRPQRRRGRDRQERGERPERGFRRDRANGHQARESDDESETIAMDALPPAIAADSDEGEGQEKPRRRRLKRSAEESGDEASAA